MSLMNPTCWALPIFTITAMVAMIGGRQVQISEAGRVELLFASAAVLQYLPTLIFAVG